MTEHEHCWEPDAAPYYRCTVDGCEAMACRICPRGGNVQWKLLTYAEYKALTGTDMRLTQRLRQVDKDRARRTSGDTLGTGITYAVDRFESLPRSLHKGDDDDDPNLHKNDS